MKIKQFGTKSVKNFLRATCGRAHAPASLGELSESALQHKMSERVILVAAGRSHKRTIGAPKDEMGKSLW